jgi:hypothetical protein
MRAAAGWLIAIGAALVYAAPIAAEDGVAGEFRVGDRAIVPTHAAAYPVRDPRDPHLVATEVVLCEGPVDADAAVAALSPHQQVINQKGLGNYILLWVRPGGEVSMNATFAPSMTQYLDKTGGGGPLAGALVAKLTATGPKRIAGRVYTQQPVRTKSGESYRLDVRFDSAVTTPAAGTRLDAGGGEPGRAFSSFFAALARKDWEAVRSRLSHRTLTLLAPGDPSSEESRNYALEVLDVWLPKKRMKIGAGELRGDAAILDVEGASAAGQKALYLVRMIREADEWRFDESAMAGLL